ncbi:hypothetical protein MNBD_ALPHA12-888, partial [hydrothermal vent metagenome]
NLSDLTAISSFASSTFLLIFASINLSAFRLSRRIGINPALPLAGIVLTVLSWLVLNFYLWQQNRGSMIWIALFYLGTIVLEILFSLTRKRGG